MPIRPLPPLLVNQIAAGEVIERPASVVKELLENAIDAGATRIDVAVENGGRDLIRVSDNGAGIPGPELPLAVAPHATSKIAEACDLNAIATLGFRGEALASMASVSRLTIVSRPPDSSEAMRLEVEGGELRPVRPDRGPVGTSVTVRNLFFNTPARRKFLRTDQTETARVVDAVEALAISHPSSGLTLTVDGRPRLDLPPQTRPLARILAVLGADLADQLLELRVHDRGIDLWGLLGRPEVARGTARSLRIYLNGRSISDRSVTHAIREAYRGLIAPDRYPTVVVLMQLDPGQVDVNVHPAKAEVRFRQQSLVHQVVQSAVATVLRDGDLIPALDLGEASARLRPFGSGLPASGHAAEGGKQFVEQFMRLDPRSKGFVYTEVKEALRHELPELLGEEEGAPERVGTVTDEDRLVDPVRPVREALLVHDCYVVTQDEQGLVIIDQHALHERVMFEQLKERVSHGTLEAQRLLTPAVVEVSADPVERLDALRPLLSRLGIEAEQIGPRTVAVHAFTSLLFERKVDPVEFVRDLLERAERLKHQEDPEAALHEVLDMMACKAAVKAGDRLSPRELAQLLAAREMVERSSRCPHGRPTTLRLTLRDLDRQFGR